MSIRCKSNQNCGHLGQCAAEPIYRRGQLSHPPADWPSDQSFVVLRDSRSARTNAQVALHTSICGSETHRVLRTFLRRQDGRQSPPLLDSYALSICSGDFNEWVWKTTTVLARQSYLLTKEYDMYEFDFANTVNYAELAELMAPRPFMVERGHDDPVGLDEWVAFEYAKVREFYDKMGIGDQTEIEFFSGPHEVHRKGTFRFLKQHLQWPE